MTDDCLFCKIIRKEIPADVIYEDNDILAFRDISPQAPVHFLVIPKKHISGPSGLSPEDEQRIGKIMRKGSESSQKEGIDHYRVIFNNGEQAGQTVFHLHMHILGGRDMNWPPG